MLGAVTRVALLLSGALLGGGLLVSGRGSAEQPAEQPAEKPAEKPAAGGSLVALKAQIADLEGRVGVGQGPARGRACKVNSEGVCVYREKEHREARKLREGKAAREATMAADPEVSALIAAYEAFLGDPAGAAAPEAPAYRYHLALLLVESGAGARARPHLERLTDGSDVGPRAGWAAMLLVDMLVLAWTEGPPAERDAAGRELERELSRLRGTALWQADAGRELRAAEARIEAGLGWARAEAERRRGTEADEPHAAAAAFAACGREFQALHAKYGDRHDRADALLWNAGVCFEAAHEVGVALRLFASLVDAYPQSEFVEKATLQSAAIYESLARYGDAVEWYERLAATYPRSQWTPDALARAVASRAALGPPRRLVAALAAYEALYANKDPRRAAEIRWSGYASVPRDDAARRAYVEGFLVDHGKRAAPALWLAASAEHARLVAGETCPKGQLFESLCLTGARGPSVAVSLTNGPAAPVRTTRWTSARRLDARYEAALQEAASVRGYARARGRDLGGESGRGAAAEAVAAAALLQADAALEAIVAGRSPPQRRGPLHLTVEEATPEAAQGVVVPPLLPALGSRAGLPTDVAEEVDAVDEAYAVIERLFPGTPAAIRARARAGLLREWLADRALLALKAGSSGVDRSSVLGLRAEAIVAYRRCLAAEPAALAAGESVAQCERGLAALSPHDSKLVHELFGAAPPGYPADRADVAGPVLDADEAMRIGGWLASEEAAGAGLGEAVPRGMFEGGAVVGGEGAR